jgi:hypothetical protein
MAGGEAQFRLGGALINAGYRLQDPMVNYDFAHEHPAPPQVWEQFLKQNHLASSVREIWPRTARHPLIAMVTCMDSRLDTNEIAGDTRRYYYVVRLAGSVLSLKEEEMLELAADNGVEVIVFTTHSDCAAEKAAKNEAQRRLYPNLVRAVDERASRFEEFLGRPGVKKKVEEGHLIVKWMDLDTNSERVMPHVGEGRRPRLDFREMRLAKPSAAGG